MESYSILRVDLSNRSCRREVVPESLLSSFIGGKGLAAHYLATSLPPGVDPLGADNVLIFMAGPVCGLYPGTCRFVVASKSPLTGGFNDSYAGGYFAWALRRAGLLGIVVTGKSDTLVLLRIEDDTASIEDAGWLAGMSAAEVDDEPLFKDYRVAAVGVGGENGVLFANIANNAGATKKGRSGYNGRGGAGTVMGAKGLKAIAVRGTSPVPKLSPEATALRKEFSAHLLDEGKTAFNLLRAGTAGYAEAMSMGHLLPTRNWRGGSFEGIDQVGGEAVAASLVASDGCYNCPVRCGKHVRADPAAGGAFPGAQAARVEYETIGLAAANTGNADFTSIVHFSELCDHFGLDTISAGSVIAFAMDCAERGLIDHPIRFGDSIGQAELLRNIAYREGLGDILADGLRAAAHRFKTGPDVPVVEVKGLELAAYEPRGAVGMALAFATADRGGCHNRSWSTSDDAFSGDVGIDPWSADGKAARVIADQNASSANWSVAFCEFIQHSDEEAAKMLSSVGVDVTAEQFRLAGERIWNLTRLINLREGWTAADDCLPAALLRPQSESGRAVAAGTFERMKAEYYSLRKWTQGGNPTRPLIESLGLSGHASVLGQTRRPF
jgi:aldehyde:ferredoxin oxidoreductase